MQAALPENESERLEALYRYGALNAIPEPSFNRLTRLAAHLFSAPIAMVTLLDADRLVIKSGYGIDLSEVSRDQCFCAHAILSDGITIIGDATQDCRFSDNPVVVGARHVRFYAGALLETPDGFRLGTLCVADTIPRSQIGPTQLADLKDLAAEVMELLELHRAKREISVMQTRLGAKRRQLEESRELWRKTEQRAMLALDAGHMGYWERDAKTDLVTLSPSLSKILGMEPREHQFSMEEWLQSVHPDDRAMVEATIEKAGRTQENYLLKYRTQGPDGSERWLSSSGTYRKDEAGNFSGAQGVSWDSTAFDTAARQLKTSEELFRGLSDSAPVGVFCEDTAGRVTYANARTAAIFGRPVEELLGCGWLEGVHPGDKARMIAAVAETNTTLAVAEYECRLVLPDGTIRWVQMRTSIMRDESGHAVGKIGTLDDVSQRRQTMQDLEHAKEAAEVANRAKDMFLANVSHELRTPLNGVLGMTELLLDTQLDQEQQEMAQTVRESGRSLLTLVNDMLDVGRIEAGTIKIERLPFELPIIIRQTVSLLESEARKKGLSVRVDYPADLESCYFGDPHRIEQILLNYLSNAVKFSSAGEIKISVSGKPTGSGGVDEGGDNHPIEILLSVTDNGLGIDPEAQKKLFQPFSQVDGSSTRRNGGVGLGLAISKRLAELMGGSVGIVSALGRGSTFWLSLTLASNSKPEASAVQSGNMATMASGRVLLVEDNPVNQKVAVAALRKLGWAADVAQNGLVALDLFCRNEYALVFMDCHMPEMDGFAATRQIRKWEQGQGRSNIPVVALTAHAMVGDRERCLAAGMNDYLAKPFGLEELRNTINRWMPIHA